MSTRPLVSSDSLGSLRMPQAGAAYSAGSSFSSRGASSASSIGAAPRPEVTIDASAFAQFLASQSRGAQEVLKLPEGNYVGDVKNGRPHGTGTLTYKASDGLGRQRYEGEFEEGKRVGEGTLKMLNGDEYSGLWVNDLLNGRGTHNEAGGKRYVGAFVNGQKHGQGLLKFPGGESYSGAFANGWANGQGTCNLIHSRKVGIFKDGELWDGEWIGAEGTSLYKHGKLFTPDACCCAKYHPLSCDEADSMYPMCCAQKIGESSVSCLCCVIL